IEETRLTCHHRLLRIADEVNQIRRSNARVFRGVQLEASNNLYFCGGAAVSTAVRFQAIGAE
ncbi:hypothetical protein ACFOOJ_14025, partial [Sphingobium xenophagum]|uniref:hypothetical protein n=1 Tax=Sphingobium xenophagum TaxID=121428 RepID=UPI00362154ED